jgi:hypothetical protein
MRLRDQPWWPSGWAALGGSSPTHGELSRDGTFVTPRLSSMGLSLAVDYNATQCTAIVTYTVVRKQVVKLIFSVHSATFLKTIVENLFTKSKT